MPMKKEDLVRLMDAYMSSEGCYIKPAVGENGSSSFFIANDAVKPPDMNASFELIKEAVGIREEKSSCVFTGKTTVECAACEAIPNLMDIDRENSETEG